MAAGDLERRVATLEAIEEIKKLQARYVDYLITCDDWDGIVDFFTEDGVADLVAGLAQGRGELLKLFKEKIAVNHIGLEGNFLVHPDITVDGDKAKARWLLYLQYAQPRKRKVGSNPVTLVDAPDWSQGYYDVEYKKVDGKWKISYLKWTRRLDSPLSINIGTATTHLNAKAGGDE